MHQNIGISLPICIKTVSIAAIYLACAMLTVQAEIDGHGPDSWRVTGVSADDTLNARMGPSIDYSVIEQFASNERSCNRSPVCPTIRRAIALR